MKTKNNPRLKSGRVFVTTHEEQALRVAIGDLNFSDIETSQLPCKASKNTHSGQVMEGLFLNEGKR